MSGRRPENFSDTSSSILTVSLDVDSFIESTLRTEVGGVGLKLITIVIIFYRLVFLDSVYTYLAMQLPSIITVMNPF
jgi:hypothetical protein